MFIKGSNQEGETVLISTKGRYALRVMLDLAQQQTDDYIPLREREEGFWRRFRSQKSPSYLRGRPLPTRFLFMKNRDCACLIRDHSCGA